MPRRSVLSTAERESLMALPETKDELIRHYTFNEADLSFINQHRGSENRLGLAVQLCYLRFPGIILGVDQTPFPALQKLAADQLGVSVDNWSDYGRREQTRREHLVELQRWLRLSPFGIAEFRRFVYQLAELAQQSDRGIVLAEALVEMLRQQRIILPAIDVIERVCSEALTLGTRRVYDALTAALTDHHRGGFDEFLAIREGTNGSGLTWLRQPPGPSKPKHMLAHLERLKTIRELSLPDGLESAIHQNRLLKLAREGGQMTAQHLRDLDPARRYATLVAVILETRATLIDEIIDLHDRFIGKLFNKAKRNHADRFQESGKEVNVKVRLYSRIGRALLDARESGDDPFAAIEAIIPWEAFSESIVEAEKLAQPEDFDYLALIADSFNQLRRYTPTLLKSLNMKAAPAARDLLAGVEVLKSMNES